MLANEICKMGVRLKPIYDNGAPSDLIPIKTNYDYKMSLIFEYCILILRCFKYVSLPILIHLLKENIFSKCPSFVNITGTGDWSYQIFD